MTLLEGWENFYVIVGSSAGALIGLQFVVITLIADTPLAKDNPQVGGAFATPSVIHFGVVLLLSSLISIPWDGIGIVAVLWGLIGLYGTVYTLIVARRLRVQTIYVPVFEDWLFHALLPLASYVAMVTAAGVAHAHPRRSLFLVAAGALALLFVGIHNAWDTVTYHLFIKRGDAGPTDKPKE